MKDWKAMSVEERRKGVLRFFNAGLSYSRIGVRYKVTTNTIAGVIHRARLAGFAVRSKRNGSSVSALTRNAGIKRAEKAKELPPKSRGRQKTSALTGLVKTHPKPPVPTRELRDISLKDDETRKDMIFFSDREHSECAWPMSAPTEHMLCCGRPVQKGFNSPYCAPHAGRSVRMA